MSDAVKIITAFTLAHSITLALAALQIVELPSRFVESAIAASVVIAAINNLFPVYSASRWQLALVFGLIHGFGFANVLMELDLPQDQVALSLLSFNAGVEVGQLAILVTFLPLAWIVRRTQFYHWGVLRGGSACAALLAFVWLVERVFDATEFSDAIAMLRNL